jgi:two-component system, chemotaxis family, chemotaxis protein CheY
LYLRPETQLHMKKQILAVDDDVVILKLLNHVLHNHFEIIMHKSGIDAFAWLELGNFPSLVISDLQMPYFPGQSFVKNLKISGFYQDTPIIVLSGIANLEEEVAKMPFKVDAYIRKPFNPTKLKETIDEILSH